ncbi:MAG: hypothetical protein ACKVQT_19325 [Burkholderiales bacterium]
MGQKFGVTVMIAALASVIIGCSQQPTGPVVVVEDKAYAVTSAAIKVKVGIMTGEVTEIKVTERVEKESGKIVSPAKMSGKLVLKNGSADQSVRLLGGTIQYVSADGELIKVEDKRTDTALKFSTYGATERLDPGQEASQSISVDFPAEALKAKRLKEIRLDLTYIPTPFKEQSLSFSVSVAPQ